MSRYLEEAAAQVRKTVTEAEQRSVLGVSPERRLEFARSFAMLAAIDKGLLPQEVADAVYSQFGGAA